MYGVHGDAKMICKNDNFSIIICNEQLEQVKVTVKATLELGKLIVSAQDIGPLCNELFGDSDYEYAYIFDEENTSKLVASLKLLAEPKDDELIVNVFISLFSGVDGCKTLREYCGENDIRYEFWNYI